jgi:hypothetical protein
MVSLIFLIGILLTLIIILVFLHKEVIKDKNKNFIPDTVEEKIEEVSEKIEETVEVIKHRTKRVKQEADDVVKAFCKAIDGIDDLGEAAKGAKRKGRKKKVS